MFNLLNQLSKGKVTWYLLISTVIFFEVGALYVQHRLHYSPTSLCIYQRLALIGILFAAIIGFFGCRHNLSRYVAIFIWGLSAYKGFDVAYLQARLQFAPSINDRCSFTVSYPGFLPLDEWIPSFFGTADIACASRSWTFLTIDLSQWMIIIFGSYLIMAVLVLVSQVVNESSPNTTWRK